MATTAKAILDVVFCIAIVATANGNRNFTVDKENHCFLKDGQPFRYVSGSVHYFRVPHEYWKDRMGKMKAAGLNALQTYVEWSGHEPEPGKYYFEGNYDLIKFLQTAQEVGLFVILRPGPYICAEREMGGFPFWLLRDSPSIRLRTMDPSYIAPVEQWMEYLLTMIEPWLYKNGGPIILLQIENEYGQHTTCDQTYMEHLRNLSWSILGDDVVLFRTDIPIDSFYKCDFVDGVMVTADFGPGSYIPEAFSVMATYNLGLPWVVTEFYSGWMDHWGQPHANISHDAVCQTLEEILIANGSVNIYMFHGGTNFGFSNGAHASYDPQPTSYDYGAPLSEAGDPTPLYSRIRDIVSRYLPHSVRLSPEPSMKLSLTKPLRLVFIGSVLSHLSVLGTTIYNQYPMTFEHLNIAYGFVLYSTVLTFIPKDPAVLIVNKVHDRAYVLVNKRLAGVLSRQQRVMYMPLLIQKNQELALLVENQGRINYGAGILDPKGLLSNVTLDGKILTNWAMTPIPLNNTDVLSSLIPPTDEDGSSPVPGFFSVNFTLPESVKPADTFLDPSGWAKGVAFLNGFNLGRYWPVMGPQVTLYVPGVLLKPYPETNILTVLELERAPWELGDGQQNENTAFQMKLVDTPKIDGPVP